MAKVDKNEFAEKWNKRMKGSVDEMRKGVEKLDVNPATEAIKKKDKMKAHWNEAIDNGTWESQMSKVTLDEWKRNYLNKGIPRVAAGVDAAKGKVADFGEALLGHIGKAKDKIKDMPDLTLEDNINRMTTFIREMSKFKYKKGKA